MSDSTRDGRPVPPPPPRSPRSPRSAPRPASSRPASARSSATPSPATPSSAQPAERPARRRNPIPAFAFPEELPVSGRREEIAAALLAHQVIIVSGETGSGKTTQLPKICLTAGRGERGRIGHTQPRRIAASSTARRIAQELNTPLGEVVGFKVRFTDRTDPGASIKLMTDGILLAETQGDPMLAAYDTLIIDEAHERSLNIDFLLGYLKQLLPRRPELKVIVTSATIDARRFAEHFADAAGTPAPVIEVSGRLYPVETRYRPLEDNVELTDAIVQAVDECALAGPGDVLVFLPGEREIRDTAEALRKHHPPATQILPLFARLSAEEQERVFKPGSARRIVLATNVAETSLTVPGIRFVVDTGLARIKRYSYRNKVEQLRIEPVSQAAANQRAGRCGRVASGICIRLYDADDFSARPRFADPEVLRSSLAGVILRMKALKLADIEDFPFLEAPSGRAIADGYHLLQELGAVDDDNRLTPTGRELAKLPLDPRVGRMILAARDAACLNEVLIIAAAVSVQDPRERPSEAQQAADQAHAKFKDEKSEFLAWVKLWKWFEDRLEHKKSNRKLAEECRSHFLSPLRMREWRDIHAQLATTVAEQGWKLNQSEATYEQVHCALLAGLLGNIGSKADEEAHYNGARGIKFYIHPGSTLVKKAGRWIMAAELTETTRLFARCVARIEPTWIERVGAHLLKKSWHDPHWEKSRGQVTASERGMLYGLTVYSGRRVNYGPIDAQRAHEIFLREGLVAGEFDTRWAFLAHNKKLVAEIEQLEHKARRPDILVDEELLYAFYEGHVPPDVVSGIGFDHWYGEAVKSQPKLLFLSRDDLMRHEAAGITTDVFPKTLTMAGVEMGLAYHFEPGSPRDGVTLSVPLFALNQVHAARTEWLVLGMLKEKVQLLLKSLPQKLRRHCVPLPEYAAGFVDRHGAEGMGTPRPLIDALIADIRTQTGIAVQPADFKSETLPAHLFMNFKLVDEHGRMLSMGRSLAQLKAEHGRDAQASFQTIAAADKQVAQAVLHENLVDWNFGELPELMEIKRGGKSLMGFPALVDRGAHCDLDVFDDPDEAAQVHRQGLLRLFKLQLKEQIKYLEKNLPGLREMSMFYLALGTQEELRDQIIDAALERACLAEPLPLDAAGFGRRRDEAKGRINLLAQEIARLAGQVLAEWAAVQKKLAQAKGHAAAAADIEAQLRQLVGKRFIRATPFAQLAHFPRYLKAVAVRIDKLRADPARDARLMAEMGPLASAFQRELAARKGASDPRLEEFRWLLEELRVGLFAQELRTPMPVSVKRLQKSWEAVKR
jgi:ATP-dependent helicase HrpA